MEPRINIAAPLRGGNASSFAGRPRRRTRPGVRAASLFFPCLAVLAAASSPDARPGAPRLDVLIAGGRVIDPSTGRDGAADVGIRGGRIVSVGAIRGTAALRLDAKGCVVCPGFVDILSNTHPEGDPYKVMDGVTTVLSTHGGPVDVRAWYGEQARRRPLVNYGTVVGHGSLRQAAGALDRNAPATPAQVAEMVRRARASLAEGALGVGFGIEYIPGASGQEVTALAAAAASRGASVHAHIRLPHLLDPFQGINELIAAAAVTGARVQIAHIGSMAIRRQKEALALIAAARKRGIDIEADVYPYDAWMAPIQSALFDEGWQQKYLIDFKDLVWVKTGERVTADSFPRLRAEGGHVACHQIPEEEIDAALQHPLVSVASDGFIGEGPAPHPRSAGTFARVLGRYVRERRVLSLAQAVRKMTVQPLRRLSPCSRELRERDGLAAGKVADITVFHPGEVLDLATFQNARQFSRGIRYVLVGGEPIVSNGRLVRRTGGRGVAVRSQPPGDRTETMRRSRRLEAG